MQKLSGGGETRVLLLAARARSNRPQLLWYLMSRRKAWILNGEVALYDAQ